jgi:pimeloyl-ACP methyl ester carboxylesterase
MTLKTRLLSKNGAHFAYQDHGAGEPLVLIHGVGLQSDAWYPQIAALAKSYRIIALDMPGHGRSDPLPAQSELKDYVAWCHAAITALDVGPVNLAGHSMGAMIAAGYATKHAAMLRRVAVLNGVYNRDPTAKAAVVARANAIWGGAVDLETPLSRWFEKTLAEQAARAQVAKWLQDVDPTGYATAYSAFANGDATYADQFANITCPFLSLTGSGDPNSTPQMAKDMARAVHDGQAAIIDSHKHMVNLTAAEQVNARLLAWLKLPVMATETT